MTQISGKTGFLVWGACALLFAGCAALSPDSETKIVVQEVRPEPNRVVIDLAMSVKYYSVPHVFCERLSDGSYEVKQDFGGKVSSEVVAEETSEDLKWKKLFAKFDVLWPEGSSATYLQNIGKIRVRNTIENLELIDQAMECLTQACQQIEVGVDFLDVDSKTLDDVGRQLVPGKMAESRYVLSDFDGIPAAVLRERLLSRRDVGIASEARVLTRNGENAVVRDVVEHIYPQDYDVQMGEMPVCGTNETRKVRQSGFATVEPQNFTMREVGTILDVTPTLSDNDLMIDLDVKLQLVEEPRVTDYGMSCPAPDGGRYALPMNQPFFPMSSIDSHVKVDFGGVALAGAVRVPASSRVKDVIRLVFVRARKID